MSPLLLLINCPFFKNKFYNVKWKSNTYSRLKGFCGINGTAFRKFDSEVIIKFRNNYEILCAIRSLYALPFFFQAGYTKKRAIYSFSTMHENIHYSSYVPLSKSRGFIDCTRSSLRRLGYSALSCHLKKTNKKYCESCGVDDINIWDLVTLIYVSPVKMSSWHQTLQEN